MNIPDVVGHKFLGLAHQWKLERGCSSRVKDLVATPAHEEIVKMGWAAVPCIIREFVEGRVDHWFWALHVITGENPVKEEHRGYLKLMAEDWCRWWRDRQTGTAVDISND
jgi:hypothetical protein